MESPAAAGARFGLGLDYLFEHQESLRIDSQRTVVSLPTENGGTLDDIVDGDPDLLNRKFDFEWELKGPGVQVPLALSRFRLTDLIRVFPTLTLEAASVDVTLDSVSKTELNPKTTLEGRGSLFGVKLGATASLCGDCIWFNGTTYHYRNLPAFKADRSPAFAEPGFEVLHDEVRLSQEVHEVSTKFGYIAPNQRVAYYTGVRTRWTDVEVEDELRFGNVNIRQEMMSSTKLKSKTIEVVAGVDAYLGGSIFGRTEASFSGHDLGVKVTIVHIDWNNRSREDRESTERMAREIASAIAPRLKQILAAFLEARQNLRVEIAATGKQVYPLGAVSSLLNDTERDLLLTLAGPELTAMRDYIQDLFYQTRVALGLQLGAQAALHVSAPVRLASLRPTLMQRAQPDLPELDKETADSWLDRIGNAITKILDYSSNNDLLLKLCIRSSPKDKAGFQIHPISYTPKTPMQINTNRRLPSIWRGLYTYSVTRRGFKKIQATLDLVMNSGPVVDCELVAQSAEDDSITCNLRSGRVEECPE